MTAPAAHAQSSEPDRPDVPRRFVHETEYRTSYIEAFQIRYPAALHDRLIEWAARENKPVIDLAIDVLEEAVRRRGA